MRAAGPLREKRLANNDKRYAKQQVTPLNTTEAVEEHLSRSSKSGRQLPSLWYSYYLAKQTSAGPFCAVYHSLENETPVSGSTPLQESFTKQ